MIMMEGIEALSSGTAVLPCYTKVLIAFVIILLTVGFMLCFTNKKKIGSIIMIISSVIFCITFILLLTGTGFKFKYKVKIDDSVSVVELYKKYEIVKEDNGIFTIIKKDNDETEVEVNEAEDRTENETEEKEITATKVVYGNTLENLSKNINNIFSINDRYELVNINYFVSQSEDNKIWNVTYTAIVTYKETKRE